MNYTEDQIITISTEHLKSLQIEYLEDNQLRADYNEREELRDNKIAPTWVVAFDYILLEDERTAFTYICR